MAKNQLIAKPLSLAEIAVYYNDSEAALRLYFSPNNPKFEQLFIAYTSEELNITLNERIAELDFSTSLSLLAALEAVFRIDYKERTEKKKKDSLSIFFRRMSKRKGNRLSLEDDILNAWKEKTSVTSQKIEDLKSVYKYRHWLAHGRYWSPKMGRPCYDYYEIYKITEGILNSFPFEGV